MGYREFTTAVEQTPEPQQQPMRLEFKVDDHECVAHKPSPAQYAVLMASMGRWASENDKIAGIINFFVAVCDKPTQAYLIDRLLDYEDKFDLPQVQDILEWMVQEWSGNPTPAPSVSTGSPSSTGLSSTPTTPQLT